LTNSSKFLNESINYSPLRQLTHLCILDIKSLVHLVLSDGRTVSFRIKIFIQDKILTKTVSNSSQSASLP